MSENRPHLSFQMKHHLGSFEVDASFELSQPWSLIFAPSGAGKTTILRAIAGLIKPQYARIVSYARVPMQTAGSVLTDTAARIFRPPHQRSVRMVSQNAALFPHLSVLENIRYGLSHPNRASEHLKALLTLCRVEHLAAKMPQQLSGGERQRVALARSLAVPGCTLLLLDEPFTGLDAALRDEIIVDLRVWLSGRSIPALSVTHDISEAFQLGAEVLKLSDGRITAQGPVAEVLAGERLRLLTQLA